MSSRISEKESLKRAFRDAYFAKEREGAGDESRSNAMKRIRRIGPLKGNVGFWPAFEHLTWRLVPVTCLLVLVLTVALVTMDFEQPHDYLGTVTADLEQPTLTELFGLEG